MLVRSEKYSEEYEITHLLGYTINSVCLLSRCDFSAYCLKPTKTNEFSGNAKKKSTSLVLNIPLATLTLGQPNKLSKNQTCVFDLFASPL